MDSNNSKFIDMLKLTFVAILLGSLGVNMLGILLMFFPAIFMESSIKNGLFPTLLSMFLSSLIIGLTSKILTGLSLFFVYAPMILAFHYAVVNKKSFRFTLILMVVVLLLSNISLQMGLTPLESLNFDDFIEDASNFVLEELEGTMTNFELGRVQDEIREILKLSVSLIPAMMLIFVVMIVYINYVIAGRRLIYSKILIAQPPNFSDLQIPRFMLLIFGALIGVVIILRTAGFAYYREVYLNIVLIFAFLYTVNGLACVAYFLNKRRAGGFKRFFVYFLIFVFAPILFIITVLGFIDSLVYFRRLKMRRD